LESMIDASRTLLVGHGDDTPLPRSEYGGGTLSPFDERMHRWLIGPEGLRTGWRLLLYAAMWRGLYLLLGVLTHYALQFGVHGLWIEMFAEAGLVPVAVAPAFVLASLEGRSFDSYGLPRRGAFGKLFWVGLLWGIAAITVLMFALRGAGAFDFGTFSLHGSRILKFAAFWGVFFLLVGFYEEFLVRGYTQFTLTKMVGFWPGAILLSIGFGAFHLGNPGETWTGILGAAVIGFFFCLTLRRTGNLWFAVGFHAAWDWGESYLYSVPDSGGISPGHLLKSSFHGPRWLTGASAGPEGSVLLFGLVALLWLIFDRVYPEVKYQA
jgi:membrane protease YdiL (CAAX protease family)